MLVATEDGHQLHRALGWTVDSLVTAAHRPEPETGDSGGKLSVL